MKNKYDVYQNNSFELYDLDDKMNLSKDLITKANKENIIIEKNPKILKELIDMDLRENVPPQIYEIISCVVDVIVKAEDSKG